MQIVRHASPAGETGMLVVDSVVNKLLCRMLMFFELIFHFNFFGFTP